MLLACGLLLAMIDRSPGDPGPAGGASSLAVEPEPRVANGLRAEPDGQGAEAAERFAPSLAGTRPDGALVVDAEGGFVPTPDALDFFDYYLSTLGERSLEEIVALLEREIRARVDPPDAALALLAQYLDYRDAVRELVATGGLEGFSLERRLQWLRETRRDAFGAELAERLFGAEEARLRDAIERRRIADDPTLDPEERAERLAELDALLPEAERSRRERVTLARRVLEREAALRAEGSSDADVDGWRRAEFGDAAAARLAELDRRRAAWEARVADYREQREALLTSTSGDGDVAARVEELRASLFEGPELLRIRSLDAAQAR